MDKLTAIKNFYKNFLGSDDIESTTLLYETSVIKTLTPKEILFFEGDKASNMYYLLSGLIKLSRSSPEGKETIIHFVNPNEIFAAVAIREDSIYPVTAKATQKTQVLGVKIEALTKLITSKPEFMMNLFIYATNRIKYLLDTIDSLTLKDARSRLINYLQNLSETASKKGTDKFCLPITKHELALLIGTTPETLSRIFTKLEYEGILKQQGKLLKYIPPENC